MNCDTPQPIKGDAPTILNNLLQTYEEALVRQYELDKSLFVSELRKYQDNFKNRWEVTYAQREELEERVLLHSASTTAMATIHQMMVVKLAQTMQQTRDELARLQNERVKNERAASVRVPEGISERIW